MMVIQDNIEMLSKESLQEILSYWSFWDAPPKKSLKRHIDLPKKLQNDLALVIQGVRRCGKSTLLTQFPELYGISFEQCYYCNFEDPRLIGHLDYSLLEHIVQFAREVQKRKVPCYFFFDEIQNVVDWEKWLHTQLERPQNNYFILTGSNSCLLSGEFATALTGRHLSLELFPFSFSEFKTLFPKKSIQDHFYMGGFPKALVFDKPIELLQEYFNDIILRDVLKRVNSRMPEVIKQVVKMAFETCGSELSFRKIAGVTGLTVDTVKSYLNACEEAYLLFTCSYFSFSEKKRMNRHKKYYPIDSGLRHAVTNTYGRDVGKSLELNVFLKLRKTYKQVFYWHEPHQGEVDFVVQDQGKIIPFQVTVGKGDHRHEKALERFYESYPQAEPPVYINESNMGSFLSA